MLTNKKQSFPLFVTYEIGDDLDLRGCIGTFKEDDLQQNLKQFALIAALQDTRFSPVTLDELPDLTCSVTLLTNFQERTDIYDWVIGKHGVQIEFKWKNRNHSGTFLPQVMEEQGWTQEETLVNLVRKAGCRDEFSEVSKHIKLTTYEGIKDKASFKEYKAERETEKPDWFL